jgi:hypothetical protein
MSDSLFNGKNISQSINDKALNKTIGGNDKGIKNILSSVSDSVNDTKDSTLDLVKGVSNSLKDKFTLSGQRNKITDNIDYGAEEVSMANRHRDAISGILDKTFSGNLFDVGVSTLNLLNFGSKWKIMYKLEVDKNIYPFKYLYYYNPLYTKGGSDKQATEKSSKPSLTFLDDIEDPTILGFTLKIDYDTSPLFKKTDSSENITKKQDRNQSEKSVTNTNTSLSLKASNNPYSSRNFINTYSSQHPELSYSELYLDEFQEICEKIFISPESILDINKKYDRIKYKNSYIYEIKGLDKLDNPFVKYDDKEHESLELVLGEDIRMYVNRMAFLYRNLSWSYNMGKKLIPENLLRFNLYIKVSDIRNYTSGVKGDNDEKEDSKSLINAIRNGYSRVVYELKDCEFLFDSSLNPDTLKIGGSEVNDNYANLKLRIKYRKVNRIFYSKLFSSNFVDFLIGDKYYTPNTAHIATDLNNIGFSDLNTIKRDSKTNNIAVYPSLKTRLDVLKNKGLLNEDDNDTALTRFGKSIGNKAIKAGATILDDKVQQIKNGLNDIGKNVFNNNLSSTVRDLLKDKVQTKSKILGKSLHLNTGKQFAGMEEVISFSSNNITHINTPKEDLHPSNEFKISNPVEDLHPNTGFERITPKEDLHPSNEFKITNPLEDLHPSNEFKITNPLEDLHPSNEFKITNPVEDLHPSNEFKISNPVEDLHTSNEFKITNPLEDLHPSNEFKISNPVEDLHPNTDFETNEPVEVLHTNKDVINQEPNENIHVKTMFKITEPKENLHTNKDVINQEPNEYLHDKVDNSIKTPMENINDNFKKFIKKTQTPPPNSALGGDC